MAWNRRQTTGIRIDEVKASTQVTEDSDFCIVETNLDADLSAVNHRLVRLKKKNLAGLLNRNHI